MGPIRSSLKPDSGHLKEWSSLTQRIFMPPRRNQKSKSKKNSKTSASRSSRRTAPTVGGSTPASVMLRQPPIFPPSVMKRGQLYYEYQLVMSSTLGVPGSYIFSANGAFDPNITGTGHQPMGFDNMMLFYDQYCVLSSSIKVTFAGLSTSVARVGVVLYDQPVPSTDPFRLVENGLGKMGVIGTSPNVNTQLSICTLNLHCDVPKYFGVSQNELKVNPSFVGTAAGNPTEQVYFSIELWGGFSATTMSLAFDVLLSYDIFYYEPRHPDVSFSRVEMSEVKSAEATLEKKVAPPRR